MSRTSANLLLLLAGAIWGMGFVAQQTAMDDIGPMLFIALRFAVGAICVTPFAIAEMKRSRLEDVGGTIARHTVPFFFVGLAFFLGMAFQQVGLIDTSVTNAGFLTALYVVMVPIIMVTVLGVSQPVIIWPATLMSLAGIYFLSGGDLTVLNKGDLLIILCALFWAIHVILTGRVGASSGLPVTMATTQFYITSVLAFISYGAGLIADLSELPTTTQLMNAAPEVLYAGVIAGGLGFTLQAIGQRYTSESAAAILISTESLFAALLGALILGERLEYIGYFGCGLIFAAIIIVELTPTRNSKVSETSDVTS